MPVTTNLQSAPTVGLIDQNNVLTLSWQPPALGVDNLTPVITPVDYYADWLITLTSSGPTINVTVPPPVGFGVGSTVSYSQTLGTSATPYALSMQAQSNTPGTIGNSALWQTNGINAARAFPTALAAPDITFSATSLDLGQPLTVTLVPGYLGADSWQVIWPDNTTTGWLPLSPNTRAVIKSFNVSGAMNVTVQTRRNYSGNQYNPIATLISQFVQQVFVTTTQFPTSPTSQSGLTGDLGVGGQQGFEITQVTSQTLVNTPWEVIARALVRDTVTSELKLLVATSRFNNASSLYGTMAVDVFPLEGRPRQKELVVPPYELNSTTAPNATPVQITTQQLPTLYVGKSIVQALGTSFQMGASGGTAPYLWSADPFPPGVSMNSSGVLIGTPLDLGVFSVIISVTDSSVPPSINQVTLSQTVTTDMLVQIATGQVDANNTPLAPAGSTLGVAQVGTPYSVKMVVGNIVSNSPFPGGLPPYTWSAPAGAFPQGLTIQTQPDGSGLITGTPSTYNSTTDFSATYVVTVQVTDSIGAVATHTYSMTLEPETLSFGRISQPTIYANEEFKFTVPVFGGQSPYTFNPGTDFVPSGGDTLFYGTVALIDGQIEINIGGAGASTPGGLPTTGVRTFHLSITDADSNTLSNIPISFNVETMPSDIKFLPAYYNIANHPTDGSFGLGDYSIGTALMGGSGEDIDQYEISGFRYFVVSSAGASGPNTTYTVIVDPSIPAVADGSLVGEWFAISGFTNLGNNGVFKTVSNTGTSFVVANPNGVAEVANTTLTVTSANESSGNLTVYNGTITGGAGNALANRFFHITGFVNNPQNNGVYWCVSSSATTLTLANAFGVAESASAGAQQLSRKAVLAQTQAGLPNGLTLAIDPTFVINATPNLTPYFIPEAEFYGPPGPTTITNGNGNFGNTSVYASIQLTPTFDLAGVTAVNPGTSATYTFTTSNPAAASNGYAGLNITIVGFTGAFLANNGTFNCISSTATALVLANTTGVQTTIPVASSSLTSPTLTVNFTGTSTFPVVGQEVYLSGFSEAQINTQRRFTIATLLGTGPNWTGFTASFTGTNYSDPSEPGTAITTIPQVFATATLQLPAATISREYETLAHNDPATMVLTGVTQNSPITGEATYAGNIVGGASNAFANFFFAVSGFTNTLNDGYFQCISSTATQLVLANPNAVTAVQAGLATGDIGAIASTPHPYIVGDIVGLNPRKPYFNNPNLAAINDGTVAGSSPYTSIPLVARMQAGSVLPPGLSLDANTGLIYGTLSGVATTATSVIQYVDGAGAIHGTATVNWNGLTFANAFQLTDNNALDSLQLGSAISVNAFTAPSSITLVSAGLLYGRLPNGLSIGVNANNITVSGTPTEAGYFDCWFQCQNTSGQSAYVYHRVSTVLPIATLNIPGWADVTSGPLNLGPTQPFPLPTATVGSAYVDPLTGFPVALVGQNGVPPYTWASSPTFPFNGISLATSGATAGTFGGSASTTFSQLFNFTVTDSAANQFTVNNVLLQAQPSGIHFTNSPFTISITSGVALSYQLTVAGGTPAYSFAISPVNTNALPSGIGVNSTGLVSGTTTQSGYSKSVIFRVTDNIGSTKDQAFTVTVTSGLTLKSGPDFEDSISTGYLGYVDIGNVSSINPAPNLTYFVVATGVVSTSTAQMSVNLQGGVAGITASITNLNTGTHTAQIQLSGPFSSGVVGDNDIVVSVTDSGVQASQTFKWKVFNDGSMVVTPTVGSFPTQVIT